MKKAVTYYRVSTERQGQSGLGLDAQREAVQNFARVHGFILTGEFVEVESGKKNERPMLLEALAACKREQAVLLIARLDRLGRNLAFISKLMESGVDFKAVDNPFADKFTVHILAAVAEKEGEDISKRTTAALKAAKERGVQLGSHGKYVLSQLNKKRAEEFAISMMALIGVLQEKGLKTIREITDELNRLGIPTYRNKDTKWHVSTVHKIISRYNSFKSKK